MKQITLISGFLIILFCSCNSKTNAQNIALNKSYTLSDAPNYALTSADPNHTVLTDGVYTSGYFWKGETTVGWQGKTQITIDIDLKQESTIGKITFNTARASNAGVSFPSHIFVFISADKNNYYYKGDIAADPNNTAGAYQVSKFTLAGIDQKAEFVKLVIVPNGVLVFCDEIEVIAGTQTNAPTSQSIATGNLNAAIESLVKNEYVTKKMRLDIDRIKPGSSANANSANVAAELSQANAGRLHSMQQQFNKNIIVDKVNPWEKVTTPYAPKNVGDNKYAISTVVNGNEYGAFIVTNLSDANRSINCVVNNGTSASVGLYAIPFITSMHDYSDIADPLIAVNGAISLTPGESRMFLFKVSGKVPGAGAATIKVESSSFSATLSVNIKVLSEKFPSSFSLNAVNWAYLSYPVISDRKDEAIKDLKAHDINTMVVPPNALPLIGGSDYSAYNAYISQLKPFKKLFLFVNFANKLNFKGTTFMAEDWKASFVKWYNGIVENSKLQGFSQNQLYLYAYDEVKDADLDGYYNFLTWLQKDYPNIKTFGTINSINAANKIGSLLSISQIDVGNKDLIAAIKSNQNSNTEFWLYATEQYSELLSPYSYYRLMPWQAFVSGAKGVGFWNYADYRNGSDNKLRVGSFDGPNSLNFSVIYDGPGTSIISSRRWEAFREGIEDYELLKKYAQKNGMANAKALASSVIDNPNDNTKADVVRNKILSSINN